MKKLLFSLLGLTLLSSCINDEKEEVQDPEIIKVGDKLPTFDVITSEGQHVTTDSLLDHYSMVVLFSTTCPDCRQELPRVDSLYREHLNDAEFRLICIAREQEAETIQEFWNKEKLILPYSPQPDRKVYNLFASSVIPRIYISTPDGIVRFMHDDKDMPNHEQLESELRKIKKTK